MKEQIKKNNAETVIRNEVCDNVKFAAGAGTEELWLLRLWLLR